MYRTYQEITGLQPNIMTDFVKCNYYIEVMICETNSVFSEKPIIKLPIIVDLGEISNDPPAAIPSEWNPEIINNQQEAGQLQYPPLEDIMN